MSDLSQQEKVLAAVAIRSLQAERDSLAAQLRETQERLRVARDELRNIATAKRFDPKVFENGDEFADWARSRARHTLADIGDEYLRTGAYATDATCKHGIHPYDCRDGCAPPTFAAATLIESQAKRISELEADVAELRALDAEAQHGADELSADAKRYRWVRQAGAFDSEAGLDVLSENPEHYDAAVDAAMSDKP